MKSLKTLLIGKSIIAAAIAASSLATPAIAQTTAAITANIAGTPDDGMVCRSGYATLFSAANMKCSKSQSITVALECFNPKFPTYVNRSTNAGPHNNADVCTKDPLKPGYVAITVNGSLAGLLESINGSPGVYELAKVNPATVATRTNNQDESEATALGLSASQVDTVSGFTTVNKDAVLGVKDNASVLLTHYTFAIPTGGPIIINTGPVTSPTPFAPRPLP